MRKEWIVCANVSARVNKSMRYCRSKTYKRNFAVCRADCCVCVYNFHRLLLKRSIFSVHLTTESRLAGFFWCQLLIPHSSHRLTQWWDPYFSLLPQQFYLWSAFDWLWWLWWGEHWAMCISVFTANVSVFFSSISHLNWSSARSRLNMYVYE